METVKINLDFGNNQNNYDALVEYTVEVCYDRDPEKESFEPTIHNVYLTNNDFKTIHNVTRPLSEAELEKIRMEVLSWA